MVFYVKGQNLELAGGFCNNNFYDNETDGSWLVDRYTAGNGYLISLTLIDSIKSFPIVSSLRFVNYSGSLFVISGSSGGSSGLSASGKKNNLELDLFPLNLEIKNAFSFNLGITFTYLLSEQMTGSGGWSTITQSGQHKFFNESSTGFGKAICFGLCSRISFDIKMSDRFYLLPQYEFFYELTPEYNIAFPVKAFRHYISIGLGKKFG